MNLEVILILLAAGALLFAAGAVLRSNARARERRDRERRAAAREQGLHLPPSLHPVIDPDICIGSLACVTACPEGDVLGIVNGVGALIVGANCIGHGRCATECPVGAIQLVFGTSERGVDIPRVTPRFESTVPGIYIVGELGGMGLIRNAVRQGEAVIRHIVEQLPGDRAGGGRPGETEIGPAVGTERTVDDVIVIGAGPAGFAAGMAALAARLRFRIIEQDTFGGTVAHYPRQKIVMSETIDLPLAGRIAQGVLSKEELIARFKAIRQEHRLPIQEGERAEDIQGRDGDFRVVTNRGVYAARKVVLAIGRRGVPRRLGVPGEDLPTVTYRLIEPEQYAGRPVLVIGGGDSAVEAACALADAGAQVTVSHRGLSFDRCKPANRERLTRLNLESRIRLFLGTRPLKFEPSSVVIAPAEAAGSPSTETQTLPADFVIICAGGDLPTAMLSRVGIQVDRHYGESG